MNEKLARRLRMVETRLDRLMASLERDIVWSTDNVTTPTNAELDTAFGAASTLFNGFVGVVDDAGAGTTYYLCIADADNDKWFVITGTAT